MVIAHHPLHPILESHQTSQQLFMVTWDNFLDIFGAEKLYYSTVCLYMLSYFFVRVMLHVRGTHHTFSTSPSICNLYCIKLGGGDLIAIFCHFLSFHMGPGDLYCSLVV